MDQKTALLLAYIVFTWLVVLHTFEEIACDIFGLQVGHIVLKRNRYLCAAGAISTINLGTLTLLLLGLPVGAYIGLFTTAILGVFQGIIHGVGYFRAGMKMKGMGAGFYSAIPLSIAGAVTFYLLLKSLF